MLKRTNTINTAKVNEVADNASRVLKVTYFLLLALGFYLLLLLIKETKLLHFIWTLLKIVAPLFIGIIIAWLFDPFVKWLQTKKINRTLGALITYVILFIIVFIILAALIPLLAEQISEFAAAAPSIFETIKGWAIGMFDHINNIESIDVEAIKAEFFNNFNSIAGEIGKNLPATLISIITGFFSGMGTLILGLIIGFFLLISFDSTSSLLNFIPRNIRETSMDLINDINESLRKYVQGAVIDCSVIFILTSDVKNLRLTE